MPLKKIILGLVTALIVLSIHQAFVPESVSGLNTVSMIIGGSLLLFLISVQLWLRDSRTELNQHELIMQEERIWWESRKAAKRGEE